MKKFKHKITGEVIEQFENTEVYYVPTGTTIHKRFVENCNDWEEVLNELPVKNWRITKLINSIGMVYPLNEMDEATITKYELVNQKVHSFIRLEDGEEFSIGDTIFNYEVNREYLTISSIDVNLNNNLLIITCDYKITNNTTQSNIITSYSKDFNIIKKFNDPFCQSEIYKNLNKVIVIKPHL